MTPPNRKRYPGKNKLNQAKERANEAVRALRDKKAPKPRKLPELPEKPRTLEEARPVVRALLDATPEAEGRQLVIPGAGPRQHANDDRPGDENEYVMTLRLTRKDARIMRVIAALNGDAYPATWAIRTLRDAMARELAR